MAISNEAKVKVVIDGKEAQVSVKELGKQIQKAFKGGEKAANRFKSAMGNLRSVMTAVTTVFIGKDLINASNQQEKAVAAFEQTLRSMGRYTDELSTNLQDFASQLQSEGIFGDEVLLEGAKFLATYKDITNEMLPETMTVMADFAALTGGSMASAANILGKASMGMTGELARYGITLSDAAKKSKDFNLVLKEIKTQVEGQNKALAGTKAGGMQQFANAVGDLKEKGGDLLKIFIIPATKLITPLVDALNNMDSSVLMMIGTAGLAAGTVFKVVIPALKAFGVASKSALGWIGLIVAAVQLLYVAWETNFMGIRDAIDVVWRYLKSFYEYVKGFVKTLANSFYALGEIIWGALTFDKEKILSGWENLKTALVDGWNETVENMRNTLVEKGVVPPTPLPENVKKSYVEAGTEAGKSFQQGFTQGRIEGRTQGAGLTGGIRGTSTASAPDKLEEVAAVEEPVTKLGAAFDAYGQGLENMKLTSVDAINTMFRGFNQLSNGIVDAMFGAQVKFKDIFKNIAKDFTNLFINEVLRQLVKVLVPKMIKLLMMFDVRKNDMMAERIGRDYAKYFSQGVIKGLKGANLAGAMAGGGAAPNVNISLGSDRLYDAVKAGKNRDNVRRGVDTNREAFI